MSFPQNPPSPVSWDHLKVIASAVLVTAFFTCVGTSAWIMATHANRTQEMSVPQFLTKEQVKDVNMYGYCLAKNGWDEKTPMTKEPPAQDPLLDSLELNGRATGVAPTSTRRSA